MRGQGIQPKKLYKWAIQPDGKITIFDVEIFALYDDPEPDKEKNRGKLTEKEANEIVANFYQQRDEKSRYPRIHSSHHNSMDNHHGIGFCDNLRFDGQVFFSDFADISKKDFQDIQNKRYPNRSAEYDDKKKRIRTIALLESHESFFDFPNLILEDSPIKTSKEQNYNFQLRSKLLYFQEKKMPPEREKLVFCPDSKTVCKYQKAGGEDYLEGDPEVDALEGDPEGEDDLEGDPEGDALEGDPEGEDDLEGDDPIMQLYERMDAMEQMLQEMYTKMMGGEGGGPSVPLPRAQNPEPVAMQSQQFQQMVGLMKKFSDRLGSLEHSKSTDVNVERLRNMCEINPTIDFSENYQILQKFSDAGAKKVFLDSVEVRAQRYNMHPATQFAQSSGVVRKNEVLGNYRGEEARIAKSALKDYEDSYRHFSQNSPKDFESFNKQYPDAKTFVSSEVDRCKYDLVRKNELISR